MRERQERNGPPTNSYTAWASLKNEKIRGIRGVAFDIDDTFSTEGLISADAFAALWRLKREGYALVPITGRPAGWCDHFARFWPIDAIVGENGAFTFYMEEGKRKRLDTPGGDPARDTKIAKLRATIEEEFPGVTFASDQLYRENDLAIDFCEDVPAWDPKEVDRLVDVCTREGAHAKVSSIHVNAWYGEFDKRKGFETWLAAGAPGLGRKFPSEFGVRTMRGSAVPLSIEEWVFVGDSPNDEPMFSCFPHSVGVANLTNFIDRLKTPPKYLTGKPSGAGFVEVAEKLIASRKL